MNDGTPELTTRHLVEIARGGTPSEPVGPTPPVFDDVARSFVDFYAEVGFSPPWTGYVVMQGDTCVGTCAFKGPPAENRVEIAYFTFPEFEGRGHATWMAQALRDIALRTDPTLVVAAQTLPAESASTSVLRKIGFAHYDTRQHPTDGEVWEWRYRPPATAGNPGGAPASGDGDDD